MEISEKIKIISQNTSEIFTEDELRNLLNLKKEPVAYWGIAPTGPFHMGYLASLTKVFDLSRAGIKTKIMIADIHAALDDLKTPWESIEQRAKYYQECISNAFPWKEKPEFMTGSDFQLDRDYQKDVLKLSTMTTINRAKRAASEVVRMKEPKVSEVIYPIMQALDEEYLGVDIQLSGKDHRHIMAFAREYLPKIGYKPRVEIMTPLVIGLKGPGVKMSASIPESSIKVYDSEEDIHRKLLKAYCPEKIVEDNPVLQLYKFVVFPLKDSAVVEREESHGGDVKFEFYQDMERQFKEGEIHPLDLKKSLAKELVEIFEKSRKHFESKEEELRGMGDNFV